MGVAIAARAGLALMTSPGSGLDPSTTTPDRWLVPLLVAVASLCVTGLTLPRASWIAWGSLVLAATLGSIEITAAVRALEPISDAWWPLLAGASAAGAVAATGLAAAFAVGTVSSGSAARDGRWVPWMAGLLLVLVVGTGVWVAAAAFTVTGAVASAPGSLHDLVPIRAMARISLGAIAVLSVVAVGRTAGEAVRRARRASRVEPGAFRRALIDELVPGVGETRRRAAESERAAIAADLHARVLPELRSAAAAAPASSAEPIRAALDRVEALMSDRHSVVLESFGLVAAIEWLAERVEERTGSEVVVEPEAGTAGTEAPWSPEAGRPPAAVEQAAFRIATLATDNATRHAPGSSITIRVGIGGRRVRLSITDHGPGLPPDAVAVAAASGRRGLADMRAAADSVGASLSVGPGPEARGTEVAFDWDAR